MKKMALVLSGMFLLSLSALFGCVGAPHEPPDGDEEDVGQVEQPLPKNQCYTDCARNCGTYLEYCLDGCGYNDWACQNACQAEFEYCQDDCWAWCGD